MRFIPFPLFIPYRYAAHWTPVASPDKVALVDGLGSYGSFPIPQLGETGNLSDRVFTDMHYKVRE